MANPSCTGTCPCTPTSPQSPLLPNVSHSLPSYSRTTRPLRKLSVIILCILTESRTPASLQINTPHIEYHSKSQEDLSTAAPCSSRELASPVKRASPSCVCTKIPMFLPSDAFSEVSSLFVAFQTHCAADTPKNTELSIKHDLQTN